MGDTKILVQFQRRDGKVSGFMSVLSPIVTCHFASTVIYEKISTTHDQEVITSITFNSDEVRYCLNTDVHGIVRFRLCTSWFNLNRAKLRNRIYQSVT